MTATLKTYVLAALGLFTLTLSAFAIVWPFNTTAFDDWVYFYVGQPGIYNATTTYAIRPFAVIGAQLANLIFPNQAQSIYIIHVAGLFIAAFSLFHILRLLKPGYTWFAFLVSAVYLFYIPFNSAQIIPLHFEVYSWTVAIAAVSFALFVHSISAKGWLSVAVLIAACICGYLAILSYESTFPILIAAPLVVWLGRRKFSGRFVLAALVWWAVAAIAFLQFLIPYLNGDVSASYQENFFEPVQNVSQLLKNVVTFYDQSFPIKTIVSDLGALSLSPYLSTALVVALIAALTVFIFWRLYPAERELPSPRTLIVGIGVGLILIGLGGSTYMYANFLTARSHFFVAPAQAWVLVSVFGLTAWLLRRISIAPLAVSLFAFVIVFFTLGAHWYRNYQIAVTQEGADFSHHNQLFQQILARIPDVVEGTLIIYDCPKVKNSVYKLRAADSYGIRYLYQDRAIIRSPSGVQFSADSITDTNNYSTLIGPKLPTEYRYDQLIALRCTTNSVSVLDQLPKEWGVNSSVYNPNKRIVSGFIQPWQARILAR